MMTPPTRVIFQPVRGRPFHKLLWKRLRIPRGIVHPLLSAAKFAANPAQVGLRRRLAQALGAAAPGAQAIPDATGYRLFGPDDLPGTAAAVARCAELFQAQREHLADSFVFNPNKRFLLSVLSGAEFCEHPELIHYMISRPIVDAAARYLGTIPVLGGAALWWTPANDTAVASQRFHFDNEDERQVKVFVNVFETREEHGPFTFLPADVSQEIRERVGYVTGRVDDEQVDAEGGRGRAIALTGAPGSGGFVDTARCLHFGSRGNRRERLVLMFQFLRFHSPSESTFGFQVPPDLPGLNPDEVQRLVLRVE
jgi:hypothetical protein